jgi:hypothetical protein
MTSSDEAGQARQALNNCLTQLRALVAAGQIQPAALERLERAMGSLSAAAASPPNGPTTARVGGATARFRHVPTTPATPTPPAVPVPRGV